MPRSSPKPKPPAEVARSPVHLVDLVRDKVSNDAFHRESAPTRKRALKLDEFPRDWEYRSVDIVGQAVALKVPKYVVRLDIGDNARKGTHGWQVRYDRSATRYFSDSRSDRPGHLGTPTDSLHEAKLYLKDIWQGPKVARLPKEQASKAQPTGMPGVRVEWRTRKALKACYVR